MVSLIHLSHLKRKVELCSVVMKKTGFLSEYVVSLNVMHQNN